MWLSIQGTLSEYRQRIVNFVFYRLDKNTTGFIEESELIYFFSRSVVADAESPQSYAIERSAAFIGEHGSCNKISLEQFTDYYLNKSLVTPSDAKFKSECIEEWRVVNNDSDVPHPNTTFSSSSSTLQKREPSTASPCSRNSEKKNSHPSSPAESGSPITPDSLNPVDLMVVQSAPLSGSMWSSATAKAEGERDAVSTPIPITLDPPLVPCRPSEKSVKRPARFLRQGNSESIASIDPNFSHAPSAAPQEHSAEHSEEGSRNSSPSSSSTHQEGENRWTMKIWYELPNKCNSEVEIEDYFITCNRYEAELLVPSLLEYEVIYLTAWCISPDIGIHLFLTKLHSFDVI